MKTDDFCPQQKKVFKVFSTELLWKKAMEEKHKKYENTDLKLPSLALVFTLEEASLSCRS